MLLHVHVHVHVRVLHVRMYMITYQRHVKQGKATHHHQRRCTSQVAAGFLQLSKNIPEPFHHVHCFIGAIDGSGLASSELGVH